MFAIDLNIPSMQYLVTLSNSGFFASSDASPQSWFSAATIFFPLLQNSLHPSMPSSAESCPKTLLMNSNATLMDCPSPFIIPRPLAE